MTFLTSLESKALTEFSARIKESLGENLFDLKFFGSKATGKFHDESDIDILIILKERNENYLDIISDVLLDIELKYESGISPVVLTTTEFLANQKHQTLFYSEIARDGVTL